MFVLLHFATNITGQTLDVGIRSEKVRGCLGVCGNSRRKRLQSSQSVWRCGCATHNLATATPLAVDGSSLRRDVDACAQRRTR